MYPLSISTDRLQIKPLSTEDCLWWEEFFTDNPSLEFLGIDLDPTPEEQSKSWIQYQLDRYESGRFGHHALLDKVSGEFIGQCGLLSQEIDGQQVLEVGYHILPKYWGKGFATEAATKFRDYAFESDTCERLISIIDTRNIASQRVAEKNGMLQGERISYHGLEVFVYEIDKKRWLSLRKE